MTTTVKIDAHCSDDKEVHVSISDARGDEALILQNGESGEVYAYDDRVISVKEVEKST